jgi:hypothetical protein
VFDSETLIARRYGSSRPGLRLIAIVDAALPVTQLKVEVLAQERKHLPLLDEFVIRLANMGIRDPNQMATVLGLDSKLAESAVVDQLAADNLRRAPGAKTLVELTPQGHAVAVDLVSIRPVQRTLPVTFDRLTWTVSSHRPEILMKKKEAEEAGFIVLPAARSQRILPADVTVARLNKLIAEGNERERRLEVLAVANVSPKKHLYLPMKLLIFSDEEQAEVQLGVVVDGQLSGPHEHALLEAGGHEALGINVDAPSGRPELPEDLEIALASRTIHPDGHVPEDGGGAQPVLEQPSDLQDLRDISVHEHPEFLREALGASTQRLLIIAPWIKSEIVDTSFISNLERLLRKKVKVHIAYGMGGNDRGSDESALSRLRNLATRYQDHFTFVRLKNSHAKILISDAKWITTSFNWLSFRGDPNRTYRMEEGILIQNPEHVNVAYNKYVEKIEEQSV